MKGIQTFRARCLNADVLEEGSEIICTRKVNPEVHSIDLHDALLIRAHEHQSVPLVLIRREREVKNDISVVREFFVGNETAVEEDRVRELGLQFGIEKSDKACEEARPVVVPSELIADVR